MDFITQDILQELHKQMLPEGEAFNVPAGGIYDKYIHAKSLIKTKAFNDALSIQYSMIPDNPFFTEDDATNWERRLGIIGNGDMSLGDRKAQILQKMAYPGTNLYRSSAEYLQAQLQLAGYNVYVYENRFFPGPVTKTPGEVLGLPVGDAAYNDFDYGEVEYNETYADAGVTLIANYIEEEKDADFVIGSNYRSTFFIAGATITTFANIDAARKDNFRQLILQLKPAQTVGFLFVNYV